MTAFGFSITSLTLTGTGVPDAEVCLTDGLNVISGPSDTGKTFIAQCIDFALGAGSEPKEIPEAAAYDTVRLGLRIHESGDESTLQRSLRGGQVLLKIEGEDDRVLAARHDPNREDTVSHYLLSLSGLTGKVVRKNQRGTTRTLSFRDLARLVLVDEESIISENSPVLTGQHTTKTVESNVFRLLLTGVDDSSVVESTEPRLVRSRQEAKIEVIEQLRTEIDDGSQPVPSQAMGVKEGGQLQHCWRCGTVGFENLFNTDRRHRTVMQGFGQTRQNVIPAGQLTKTDPARVLDKVAVDRQLDPPVRHGGQGFRSAGVEAFEYLPPPPAHLAGPWRHEPVAEMGLDLLQVVPLDLEGRHPSPPDDLDSAPAERVICERPHGRQRMEQFDFLADANAVVYKRYDQGGHTHFEPGAELALQALAADEVQPMILTAAQRLVFRVDDGAVTGGLRRDVSNQVGDARTEHELQPGAVRVEPAGAGIDQPAGQVRDDLRPDRRDLAPEHVRLVTAPRRAVDVVHV